MIYSPGQVTGAFFAGDCTGSFNFSEEEYKMKDDSPIYLEFV